VPCYTPITPSRGRLRQEDGEFNASMGYIESLRFERKKNEEGRKEGSQAKNEGNIFILNFKMWNFMRLIQTMSNS
jgi:hypothetical protein